MAPTLAAARIRWGCRAGSSSPLRRAVGHRTARSRRSADTRPGCRAQLSAACTAPGVMRSRCEVMSSPRRTAAGMASLGWGSSPASEARRCSPNPSLPGERVWRSQPCACRWPWAQLRRRVVNGRVLQRLPHQHQLVLFGQPSGAHRQARKALYRAHHIDGDGVCSVRRGPMRSLRSGVTVYALGAPAAVPGRKVAPNSSSAQLTTQGPVRAGVCRPGR